MKDWAIAKLDKVYRCVIRDFYLFPNLFIGNYGYDYDYDYDYHDQHTFYTNPYRHKRVN